MLLVTAWWRHQMETFSVLLVICAGHSPVTGEFCAQRPVTWSFDVFLDLRLYKRLREQSWGWWFETPSRRLWRHCNMRAFLDFGRKLKVLLGWRIFVYFFAQIMNFLFDNKGELCAIITLFEFRNANQPLYCQRRCHLLDLIVVNIKNNIFPLTTAIFQQLVLTPCAAVQLGTFVLLKYVLHVRRADM